MKTFAALGDLLDYIDGKLFHVPTFINTTFEGSHPFTAHPLNTSGLVETTDFGMAPPKPDEDGGHLDEINGNAPAGPVFLFPYSPMTF